MYDGFYWQGHKLRTVGDLLEAMQKLESEAQAQEFIKLAVGAEDAPDAEIIRSNFGYITGYLDQATGAKLRRWFNTPHPVFGFRNPSPEECFIYGREVAEASQGDPDFDVAAFAKSKGWWSDD